MCTVSIAFVAVSIAFVAGVDISRYCLSGSPGGYKLYMRKSSTHDFKW